MNMNYISKIFVGLILVVSIASCSSDPQKPGRIYMPDMTYSQAYETYTVNPELGKDSISERVPVAGTIPVDYLPADSIDKDWGVHESYMMRTYIPPTDSTGYERAGRELKNPLPNNEETLALGKKVYTFNCTPCHGEIGDGNGSIVASGAYPPVPNYKDRLPTINEGNMFYSITYGKNLMGSYSSQVTPKERWAVIYYIQKLAGTGPFGKAAPAATETAAK